MISESLVLMHLRPSEFLHLVFLRHPSVLIINHLFSLSWFDHISIAGSQGTLIHINSIAGSQGTFTYFNQCSEKTEQPRSKTQALSLSVWVSTKPQNSLCLSGPNIPFAEVQQGQKAWKEQKATSNHGSCHYLYFQMRFLQFRIEE